jgi:cyclophilin family peptidyl-prolyl cis-trans isomerase
MGSKSSVARRRQQIRKRQERQNRIIRIVSGVLIAVAFLIVGDIVWQSLGSNEEAETVGLTTSGSAMESDRALSEVAPTQRNGYYDAYPAMAIDTDKAYEALLQTSKGDIRISLFAQEAPLTVNNFVFLANQGFYDGVTFHRVIENFMAQGGDPSGVGSGGPGYQFEDETSNGLRFDRAGLLAMANAGPNTNGSQFFITFVPTPHLDGRHTIFGEVVEGEEVLSQLTRRQPGDAQPGDTIQRIEIFEGG